ncbi:hypothetical protein GMORB2_4414 [Geosmithia morbida]|uniref:Uncharacterized protein n=1 Tax=Geosmithia morbida TaxID=1094350 RepID=A0A9P5CXW9_9HYPO|nr:uncharacterized protein GMORB2_4414 [Geosmithia morbida]KAF4119748.1 hypothetical protein GMORB2_4414 [Geosmithia morbida]
MESSLFSFFTYFPSLSSALHLSFRSSESSGGLRNLD